VNLTVEIGLKKTAGASQDIDAVRDALDEAIEGLGSIFAQDSEHENESEYEITSVEVFAPAAG